MAEGISKSIRKIANCAETFSLVSAFLIAVFVTTVEIKGILPSCTSNEGCLYVLTSVYAKVMGVPISAFGALCVGLLVFLKFGFGAKESARTLFVALSCICLLLSFVLQIISTTIIKAECVLCLGFFFNMIVIVVASNAVKPLPVRVPLTLMTAAVSAVVTLTALAPLRPGSFRSLTHLNRIDYFLKHQGGIQGNMTMGDRNAHRTVVVFLDPECEFCRHEIPYLISKERGKITHIKWIFLASPRTGVGKVLMSICLKSFHQTHHLNCLQKSFTCSNDSSSILAFAASFRISPLFVSASRLGLTPEAQAVEKQVQLSKVIGIAQTPTFLVHEKGGGWMQLSFREAANL